MPNEQRENLDRVSARIGIAVLNFCRERVGKTFFAEDLHQAVLGETGLLAPASADRILRDMRQKGRVAYKVLSRHLSLYTITSVNEFKKEHKP